MGNNKALSQNLIKDVYNKCAWNGRKLASFLMVASTSHIEKASLKQQYILDLMHVLAVNSNTDVKTHLLAYKALLARNHGEE